MHVSVPILVLVSNPNLHPTEPPPIDLSIAIPQHHSARSRSRARRKSPVPPFGLLVQTSELQLVGQTDIRSAQCDVTLTLDDGRASSASAGPPIISIESSVLFFRIRESGQPARSHCHNPS